MPKGIKGFQKGHIPIQKGKTKKEFPNLSNSGSKIGNIPWNKGLKGYTNSGSFKKGQNIGDNNPAKKLENRIKISKALMGHPIYKNKNRNKKISDARKREYRNGRIPSNIGTHRNDITKRKIRITKQKRFLELGIPSSIGKNEKQILDTLEKIYELKIIRQYPILGYYIDGYIPELNLVIEVDERIHYDIDGNLREKDIQRQKEIENKLNCKFIRIKDGGESYSF